MTERKLDLERRIEALYSEREGLSTTLDESADRIVMLEKESREQDSMVSFFTFPIHHPTDRMVSPHHCLL